MDFLYKKHPKGSYEYASYKKLMDIIITLILFLLSLGLYIIGKITTGSNKNLLTIVAILGLLPACKMVVDVVMCFRVKICSTELKAKIDSNIHSLYGMYNMLFTSYDKNFYIDHLLVIENSIIGLSTDSKFSEKDFNTHISDLLRKEGLKDVFIKIFTDEDKYIKRLKELSEDNSHKDTNIAIINLIRNVTI